MMLNPTTKKLAERLQPQVASSFILWSVRLISKTFGHHKAFYPASAFVVLQPYRKFIDENRSVAYILLTSFRTYSSEHISGIQSFPDYNSSQHTWFGSFGLNPSLQFSMFDRVNELIKKAH